MSASKGNRSTLPPLADLAAELRDGHDLGDVAVAVGISADQLRYRLNAGGWDFHGEPMGDDRPRREPVVGFLQGDTSWMADAVCAQVDPGVWFPQKGRTARKAIELCQTCPAIQACLDVALADPTLYGVWGGTTVEQRRELRKKGRVA